MVTRSARTISNWKPGTERQPSSDSTSPVGLDDLGVDHHAGAVALVEVVGEEALAHSDLRRREPDALRVVHRLVHAVHERNEVGGDLVDIARGLLQHGVAEEPQHVARHRRQVIRGRSVVRTRDLEDVALDVDEVAAEQAPGRVSATRAREHRSEPCRTSGGSAILMSAFHGSGTRCNASSAPPVSNSIHSSDAKSVATDSNPRTSR